MIFNYLIFIGAIKHINNQISKKKKWHKLIVPREAMEVYDSNHASQTWTCIWPSIANTEAIQKKCPIK